MKGPVNNQRLVAGTDGRSESRSWQPFVGHLDTTATAGWSTSAPSSESGGCVAVGGFDSRAEMPLTKTSSPPKHDRLPDWSTWLITRGLWVRVPPALLGVDAP